MARGMGPEMQEVRKEVSADSVVKDIRRRSRRKYSVEEKIGIVLEGLRGEDSIAEPCRQPISRTGHLFFRRDPLGGKRSALSGRVCEPVRTVDFNQ